MSHFWSCPEEKQLNCKGSSTLNTQQTREGTALCLSLQTCFRFDSAFSFASSEGRGTLAHPAPFTQSYQKESRKSERLIATLSSLKLKQQGKRPIRKNLFHGHCSKVTPLHNQVVHLLHVHLKTYNEDLRSFVALT